jgi:sugar transferase (PEP-CTERM/EpsH1 system associated)
MRAPDRAPAPGERSPTGQRWHLLHLIHRLDTGGMENGLVNLVNHLPRERYRHTIVALTGIGAIARRIANPNVQTLALERRPGPLLRDLPRLLRLFRSLAPDLIHTRNIGTLEAQLAAWAARVPVRIHGEHGWEVHDLGSGHAGLLRTRRLMRHFVQKQVALSRATHDYLLERVGVPAAAIAEICNGVDTERFRPASPGLPIEASLHAAADDDAPHPLVAFGAPSHWRARKPVIGYVGRLADVKHPLLLLEAFERLHRERAAPGDPAAQGPSVGSSSDALLAIIGDGPLRGALEQAIARAGLEHQVWLAGDRADVAELLPLLALHALPSLAEGINNTLLEAMASGVPSVATRVGGNPELIEHERTGLLVPSNDGAALHAALKRYLNDPVMRRTHGARARERAVAHFSLDRMVSAYDDLYSTMLANRQPRT